MECLLIKVSRKKNNKIILLAPSIEKDIPFNVATLSYFVGNVNQTNPKILYTRTHGQVAVEGMQITALPPTVRRAQMNHNSAGNAIVNSKPNSYTEVKD